MTFIRRQVDEIDQEGEIMDDKSFTVRVPKRWVRIAMIVGVTALIVAPLTAIASHSFTDVPDSNTFHDDIAWLADADVTKGCNPAQGNTQFCPEDEVTRGQMAAFMRRFAQYIDAEDGTPAQADDADTVDGVQAEDLVSNVLLATGPFTVDLPPSATSEVLTLELSAGSYLVTATGTLNNNAATLQPANCGIEAGGTSLIGDGAGYKLAPNLQAGERTDFTFNIVVDVVSTTTASLSCTTSAGWSGNVVQPQIVAMSVQSATAVTSSAASGIGNSDE